MLRSGQDVCDDRRWAFISHDLEAPRLLRNIELGGQGGLRLGHRLLSMGVYFAHTGSEKLLVGYVKGGRNATNMLGGRLRSAGGICEITHVVRAHARTQGQRTVPKKY